MNELRQLLADRTIAVVGNSERILEREDGTLIDGHDIVLRMNLGLPDLKVGNTRVSRTAVGYRTDIWATARYWPNVLPKECKAIIWMKRTKLGKEELSTLMASQPHCPVYVWPQHLEDEVRNFVGADPGTGIRILYWLKRHCYMRAINTFGMDCWEANSHWSGHGPTRNHKPSLEKKAMTELGF